MTIPEQLEFDFGEEDDGQPSDIDEQRDFAHDDDWHDWASYSYEDFFGDK